MPALVMNEVIKVGTFTYILCFYIVKLMYTYYM